ncbi:hypothetical protein D3C78_1332130 [compost metagenome]
MSAASDRPSRKRASSRNCAPYTLTRIPPVAKLLPSRARTSESSKSATPRATGKAVACCVLWVVPSPSRKKPPSLSSKMLHIAAPRVLACPLKVFASAVLPSTSAHLASASNAAYWKALTTVLTLVNT